MGKPDRKTLTAAEWNVMECFWEREGTALTGREVAERLAETVGWSRSTALTMLGRMEKKGLLSCAEDGKLKTYLPLLARADAARRETMDFLSRVYRGSVGQLLSAVTEQAELSEGELKELYAILDQVKGGEK